MKKIIAVSLILCMLLLVVGCGNQTETTPKTTEPQATDENVEVMDFEAYKNAAVDDKVVIEAYIQAMQSWWEDKVTVYAADKDGAYFIYNMACTKEENALLAIGTKIRVTGYKAEWSGEVEIAEGATFEIIEGDTYIAPAFDATEFLGKDELINYQNQFVSFKGLTVEAANDEGAAYIYNWDGSGEDGDDLYFNASLDGTTYSFTVESYLCDKDSDVYKAVKELNVGDTVDLEGFLYWYEGANPHITSVTVK